jgi:hypothetical protein
MRKFENLFNFKLKREQIEIQEAELKYLLWQEGISKDLFSFWNSIKK